MKKNWYYDRPKFFHGLAFAIGVVIIAVPLWAITQSSGCDFYFGSKIVQTLNEGDGGQDGE